MSFDAEAQAAWIEENLVPEPLPFAPRFSILAALPDSGLGRLRALADTDDAPYWAYVWPGGAALVRHMLARPDLVRGKRVLDFGCGSGIAGIVASRLRAAHVVCADRDPLARVAAGLNARLNGAAVEIIGEIEAPKGVEVVLAGDVFYGQEIADDAFRVLGAARAAGADVLVGDIDRGHLAGTGLAALASYPVRDVGDGPSTPPRRGTVYRLTG